MPTTTNPTGLDDQPIEVANELGRDASRAVAPIDVLMTTYARERPEFLRQCLESLYRQTVSCRKIVLVIDGPVPEGQLEVVRQFENRPGPVLHVKQLKENVGLGRALNAGLTECDSPWIARMDSDDISRPDRFEKEWKLLQETPEVDVVFSWQGEFVDDWHNLTGVKTAPPDHDGIANSLRWRNLIAHPSIVVRRSALEKVGGYWEHRVLEDYDLWWRLVSSGAKFACVQESLVPIRVVDQRGRRGGWRYVVNDWRMRHHCWQRGDFGFLFFIVSSTVYTLFRLVPSWLMPALYRLVRRPATE